MASGHLLSVGRPLLSQLLFKVESHALEPLVRRCEFSSAEFCPNRLADRPEFTALCMQLLLQLLDLANIRAPGRFCPL